MCECFFSFFIVTFSSDRTAPLRHRLDFKVVKRCANIHGQFKGVLASYHHPHHHAYATARTPSGSSSTPGPTTEGVGRVFSTTRAKTCC